MTKTVINWCSPIPPDQTDIANYTIRLLPALRNALDVQLFTTQSEPTTNALAMNPVTVRWPKIPWKKFHRAAHSFFHIGNNIHFHGDWLQIARVSPGIVVMHDFAIHETVLNWFLQQPNGRQEYFRLLTAIGGEDAARAGTRYLDERSIDTNELASQWPLHQFALQCPTGVVTHNPDTFGPLREATNAPVLYAPLSYCSSKEVRPPVIRYARPESEPYTIIFFGFIGSSNRRMLPFLDVLAASPVRERFHLNLVGKYPKELVKEVNRRGLQKQTTFYGFVDDPTLNRLLEESDLCVNLRWPSRGEASGTLLRAWNASLPTILTRTGFYKSVPLDCALFVDPDSESADLHAILRAFVENPSAAFELGLNGRSRLLAEHSTETYVNRLKGFLEAVEDYQGNAYPDFALKRIATYHLAVYPDPIARESLIQSVSSVLAHKKSLTPSDAVSDANP